MTSQAVDSLQLLRVSTAEALAHAMNEAGIQYVLVNGLYGYPDRVGRDLDLLIRRQDAPKAIDLAEQIRQRFGWDSILLRWSPYDTWQLFFVRKDTDALAWLEVDLMHHDTMLLGGASFVQSFEAIIDGVDSYRGPFPISKLGHYIKAQLRPILYGDFQRFETRYALDRVTDPAIQLYLRKLMGTAVAERFFAATCEGVEGVRRIGPELKWAINRKFMMRHPGRFTRNLIWSRLIRPWRLYWHTSGLVFAVVNPDIQIEESVFEHAVDYFNGCFQVRRAEFTQPSSKHPSGASSKLSNVQSLRNAVRLLLDVNVRYYFRDRFLPKSVIQFVLYNGSPGEPAVNPQRFGIRPGLVPRLLRRWTPKPIELLPPRTGTMMKGKALGKAIVEMLEEIYAISSNRKLKQICSNLPLK